MSAYSRGSATLPALFLIVSFLAVSAGCTTTSIGDISYSGKNLTATITSEGPSSGSYIQLTVFRTSGLSQEEYTITGTPVSLKDGTNIVTIPVDLEPGTYKIYLYLIRNGERSSAAIRDIGV